MEQLENVSKDINRGDFKNSVGELGNKLFDGVFYVKKEFGRYFASNFQNAIKNEIINNSEYEVYKLWNN